MLNALSTCTLIKEARAKEAAVAQYLMTSTMEEVIAAAARK